MKKKLVKLDKSDVNFKDSMLCLELESSSIIPASVPSLAAEIEGQVHHILGRWEDNTEYILLTGAGLSDYIIFAAGYIFNKTSAVKAYITAKYLNLTEDKNKGLSVLLPCLGEGASDKNLAMLNDVGCLDKEVLVFLHSKNVSLKNALVLTYPCDENKAIFPEIIKKYSPSASQLRIIAEYLLDISMRDNLRFNDILKRSNALGAAELIGELYAVRYPKTSGYLAGYEKIASKLSLPPNVKLNHDKYFENNRLSLEISFKSPDELVSILSRLISKKGVFEEIKTYTDTI